MAKPIKINIVTELSGTGLTAARKQLDELEKKLPSTTEGVTKHGLAHRTMGELSGNAGTKIQELSQKFTSQLGPAGGAAQKVVAGITDKLSGMSLGSVAAIGGIAALGLAMFKIGESGVDSFTKLSAEVRQFNKTAGTTSEQSSVLVKIANDLGLSTDSMAAGFARLSKNAGGSGQALADAGVQIGKTKDGAYDAWKTLGNVADAFAATDDQSKKAAIGNAAFGRGWTQLTGVLKGGRQNLEEVKKEAERLGLVMSDADNKAALKLKVSMNEFHESLTGVKIEIGRGIVPSLADMTSGLTNISEHMNTATRGAVDLSKVASLAFTGMTLGLNKALGAFAKHKDAQKELQAQTEASTAASEGLVSIYDDEGEVIDAATVATTANKEAQKRAADATKDYEDQVKKATQATNDMADAQRAAAGVGLSMESAQLAVTAALHDQMQKTADLDTAIKDHGTQSEEARAAQADLAQQTIATKQTFIAQADAAVTLATNQAAANGHAITAAEKAAIQRQEYQNLADGLAPGSPLQEYLRGLITNLNNIPTSKHISVDIEQNYHSTGINGTGGVTVRAAGGPLHEDQASIVGENGPELFVPNQSGKVVNARDAKKMLDGSDASGGTVNNFHNTIYMQNGASAKDVVDEMAWQVRTRRIV